MFIVWVIFTIISIASIYVSLNRGLYKTGISFIGKIVSIIISFIISRVLVNFLSITVGKEISRFVKREYGANLFEVSTIQEFLSFITSIAVGVVAFYIIYFIVSIIITILKHVLFYDKADDSKLKLSSVVSKLLIVCISAVSTALTFMILLTPTGVIYNTINDKVPVLKDEELPFVSETFFNKLTEMPDNKNDVQTTKEIQYTINLAFAASGIYTDGNNQKNVEEFKDNFEKSYFLPTVIGEVGSSAAKQWKNGDDYFGMELEIADGREGELQLEFLNILEKWNKKTVVNDVNTIINILTVVNEYGPENLSGDDEFIEAIADEKFLEELFIVFYSNEDFAQLVPAVIKYGLGTAFDYMDIELDEEYIESIDITKTSEEDVRRQARLVSETIKTILTIKDTAEKINNNQLTEQDVQAIVDDLSELKDDEVLGDIANELIVELQSNLVNIQF